MQIWKFAKVDNFSIVTFDADFENIANINGCPPKIIWFRFGNTTTNILAEKLNKNRIAITESLNSPSYKEISCLEIH